MVVSMGIYPCKTYLNKLYILQKKAVRCIANVGMLEHTLPLFQKLHILPLEYMYDLCVGQFMYRQVTCVAPVSILPQITFNQNIHHYETQVSANVHVQYRRTHHHMKYVMWDH